MTERDNLAARTYPELDPPRCSHGGCDEPPIVTVHWAGEAPTLFRFCRTHASQQMLGAIKGSA